MIAKQVSPCRFCKSRHLVNQESPFVPEAGYFRVECLFCHSFGPPAISQEQAWDAWNGDLLRVTPGFGVPEGLLGG